MTSGRVGATHRARKAETPKGSRTSTSVTPVPIEEKGRQEEGTSSESAVRGETPQREDRRQELKYPRQLESNAITATRLVTRRGSASGHSGNARFLQGRATVTVSHQATVTVSRPMIVTASLKPVEEQQTL